MTLIVDPTLPRCPECNSRLLIIKDYDSNDTIIICEDCGEEFESEQQVKLFTRKYWGFK
jgi:DNA-directed RNA polymerase subunit RPC12/RpoP